MQSVTCRTCGNRVLAEKNGTFHTNIQWLTDDTSRRCARIGSDAPRRTCPDLHDTVDALAVSGVLPVTERADPRPAHMPAVREHPGRPDPR